MSNYRDLVDQSQFDCPVEYRQEQPFPTPPTMLAPSERQLLAWLTRSVIGDNGAIVDLGTWLGGSTVSLATGLEKNSKSHAQIDSYDKFLWKEKYNKKYGFSWDLGDDSNFYPHYMEMIKNWKDRVNVRPGDICQYAWSDGPIEILFIDILKIPAIAAHVAKTFFPSLIPGVSFVVHQDYKHAYTYWIHLMAFRLRKCLAPVLNVADAASTVFKLVSRIPEEELDRAVSFSN